jgi:hypothetical protein
MNPPIEIDVGDAVEGRALVDCLSRYGFIACSASSAGLWRVEVRSPRESPRRLLLDLVEPLDLWLREHPRAELVVRLNEGKELVERHV